MDVGGKGKAKYKGVADCFKKVIKKEGMNGLFTGATANLLRGIGASVVLVLYDDLKKLMDGYMSGH
jgi:solute carrier family 25 (adenine nucleotide translocator) protein 4/5/6/31